MNKVTLISTEHRESGKCNSGELYRIIESIGPEVIFEEETDDDKYHSYYNQDDSFKSLEIQTITKYKRDYDVKNIPVDGDQDQYLTFEEWEYLDDFFKQYTVYKQIINEHCSLRNKYGFAYLNSERCFELFKKMKITEEQLISFSGPKRDILTRYNTLFQKKHDVRENTMLQNIYKYSKENQYNQAVFLLGYAHRKSMEKKISEYESNDTLILNWSFYSEHIPDI